MKRKCKRCGKVQRIERFRLNRGKPGRICKPCDQARQKKWEKHSKEMKAAGHKKCTCCHLWKFPGAFGKMTSSKDGLRPICNQCKYRKEKEAQQAYNQWSQRYDNALEVAKYDGRLNGHWACPVCGCRYEKNAEAKNCCLPGVAEYDQILEAAGRPRAQEAQEAWAELEDRLHRGLWLECDR